MSATMQTTEFAARRDRLEAAWTQLPDKSEESVEAALRTLWFAAAGAPCSMARADRLLPSLGEAQLRTLDELVERRTQGEPLAYIVGLQSFMGLELETTRAALIPRVETEILARTALERLSDVANGADRPAVLDICTGCGNVALALAHHSPTAEVFAADLSQDAVTLARSNATRLGLQSRVTFEVGDLYAPFADAAFERRFHVVTCNPPYISSAKVERMPREISEHEPRMAFDGGSFGLDIVTRAFSGAPRFLKPGGWFCFELGAGQGNFLADRVRRSRLFAIVEEIRDRAGTTRVIAAKLEDGGGQTIP